MKKVCFFCKFGKKGLKTLTLFENRLKYNYQYNFYIVEVERIKLWQEEQLNGLMLNKAMALFQMAKLTMISSFTTLKFKWKATNL